MFVFAFDNEPSAEQQSARLHGPELHATAPGDRTAHPPGIDVGDTRFCTYTGSNNRDKTVQIRPRSQCARPLIVI